MTHLNLLVLRCRDPEASRAFYERFGFVFAEHVHGAGPRHFAAETGGFVLELYPAPSAEYGDQTGVGFAVADLRGLHERLVAGGLGPGAIKDNPWGVSFVVRDPDGRRVEVQQSAAVEPG